MPISHTNRKGRIYYLCRGTTRTGQPRYYFALEPTEAAVDRMPDGYEVQESVNGVVSLALARPHLIFDEEVAAVKTALQAHPKARRYRLEVKPDRITIYEATGPDPAELAAQLGSGFGRAYIDSAVGRLEAECSRSFQYASICRSVVLARAR